MIRSKGKKAFVMIEFFNSVRSGSQTGPLRAGALADPCWLAVIRLGRCRRRRMTAYWPPRMAQKVIRTGTDLLAPADGPTAPECAAGAWPLVSPTCREG